MGAGRQGLVVSRGNGLGGGESGLVVADAACGGDGSGLGLEEAVWEGLERATSGGWAVVGTGRGPGAGQGRRRDGSRGGSS